MNKSPSGETITSRRSSTPIRWVAAMALTGSLLMTGESVAQEHSASVPEVATSQNKPEVRTEPLEGTVALTFDDGPHPIRTPQILDILDRYDVKATFFVLGWRVERYPEIVRDIVARGHSVQNHSYQHIPLAMASSDRVEEEMLKTNYLIARHSGAEATCMRPPYGSVNRRVSDIIEGIGLKVVMWSLDSQDYAAGPSTVYRNISRANQGENILAHDIHADWLQDIGGQTLLERFIVDIHERGLGFSAICANPAVDKRFAPE